MTEEVDRENGNVRAFVPGHITGFFSPYEHDDPARAGSRGAGLTLSHGVTVRVHPAASTTIVLNGDPTSFAPVEGVLDALDVTARVTAETPLPVGAGFGVSGAMSLGTALAANHVFDTNRSENELITIAHVAEVEAGTGLGDVVAQARGGIPIRLDPGAPDHGVLDGIPTSCRVEYRSFGELSTVDILGGDTEQITTAGTRALDRLVATPTLEAFMAASRAFARDVDLLAPRVKEAIEAVEAAGGSASMVMLGETVFAIETGLTDAGYDAHACETHPPGATLER